MAGRKMTLDSLFDCFDGDEEDRPNTFCGSRHSLAVSGAKMVGYDPSLRSTTLEDLFGPEGAEARPRGLSRFHSLPSLLYSETDQHDSDSNGDSPKSDGDVKRKSLLERIDSDHPASPSKDTDGNELSPPMPGSPKRRRSLRQSTSPISRPSLIEQETAALARAAAVAAAEAEGEYGSDTDTMSGEASEHSASSVASFSPPRSYAPRASLVTLTQRNFEQQMRDEAATAAFQAQQQFGAQQQFAPPPLPPSFMPPQLPQAVMAPAQMAPAQQLSPQMLPQMAPQMPPPLPQMFAPIYQPQSPPQPMAPVSPPSQSVSPPPFSSPARSHHSSSPPRGHPTLKLGQTGNLLELAMDKKGSRQLQDGLPKMSDSQLVRACDELGPHLLMLAKHPAANYVVSRLASLPHAHSYMIQALEGHVTELLVHPQGSRVVQSAIAELPMTAAAALVAEIRGRVLQCALDTHGSWGICAAYKRSHAAFILSDVVEHIEALSKQQHGCRVVQRVLAEAAASGAGVDAAAQKLLQCDVGRLAVDPFGNYAVQVAMRHSSAGERARLVGALLPRLLALSLSKHGSNVAEALLTLAAPQQLQAARAAFFANTSTLRELTGHPFGNYVLQAMLRLLGPEQRAECLREVEAHAADTTFGRTIVTHFGAPEKA